MKENKMTYLFLIVCLILIASRSSSSSSSQAPIDVQIDPDGITLIGMDTTKSAKMIITFASFRPTQGVCKVETNIETLEPESVSQLAAITENQTVFVPVEQANQSVTLYFTIKGIYLGYFNLIVNLSQCIATEQSWTFSGSVVFVRNAIFQIFRYGLLVVVTLNQFNMGTQTKREVLKECFTKPIGPAIGLFCQFVLMPGVRLLATNLVFALLSISLFFIRSHTLSAIYFFNPVHHGGSVCLYLPALLVVIRVIFGLIY